MKQSVLFLALMLMVVALPAAAQPPELHVPVPAGWTLAEQEYRYTRETLYEYINGAAELFLEYRFRELVVADFELDDLALTVCVYDMGLPLDAFGIFEAEKPRDAGVLRDIGTAAVFEPPYRGLFIKNRFYVKVEVGGGDVPGDKLQAVLRDVAAGLPGDSGLPPELAALPEPGRIPGTVAFTGAGFLGFDDLKACLHADYEDAAGHEFRLFVMKPNQAFLSNESGKWEKSEQDGKLLFTRQVPYRGAVVLLGDAERLVGVTGFGDIEAAIEVLNSKLP